MTRAKRILWLTWSGAPSRFLRELGIEAAAPGAARSKTKTKSSVDWTPDAQRLREWRLGRAKTDGVPPYVVFHDSVLVAIADRQPASLAELSRISGVGPAKLERYGDEVLAALVP